MKKFIEKTFKATCLILITLSMISIAMSLISISRDGGNVYDVDKDGKVNSQDLFLMKKYLIEGGQ